MSPPFSSLLNHIEPSLKRIRVLFAGKYIVDTKKAKLVWEHKYYPNYFFEASDVSKDYLHPAKPNEESDTSDAITYDVVVGGKSAPAAAVAYKSGDFSGLMKIAFSEMDAWFEEEEEIFIHAKDPYKRVDVLQSSRHVRVEVNGVEVANTHKPRLLFETLLPVRTYIPKTDCRLDLLEHSDLTTNCPYKGTASYYSVRLPDGTVVKDIVWWYPVALNDCLDIKGFVAFYDEKVDVWVDGEKQEKPKSLWS